MGFPVLLIMHCAIFICMLCWYWLSILLFSTVLCNIDVHTIMYIYMYTNSSLRNYRVAYKPWLITFLCTAYINIILFVWLSMVCQLFIAKFDCIMLCSIVSYSSNLSNVVLYPTVMCIYVKNHSMQLFPYIRIQYKNHLKQFHCSPSAWWKLL